MISKTIRLIYKLAYTHKGCEAKLSMRNDDDMHLMNNDVKGAKLWLKSRYCSN